LHIDPEIASFLDPPFPNDMDDLTATRQALEVLAETEIANRDPSPDGLEWFDQIVSDEDGRLEVTVRIYRRTDATSECGALLFVHGGAFVFGDLESEHARCVRLASAANCVVVSVDYRLAPEHPYPAALDDVFTSLNWLRRNSAALNVDPTRIGVGGVSAGGAIAAGVVLKARDVHGPWLRVQLLVYPVIDNATTAKSIDQFFTTEPWDGERTRKIWPMYLKGLEGDVPPYASVARATDLSRLPTTYLMTAEGDPLRDEGLHYAQRLLDAGVSVEVHNFLHTYHGFDVVAPGSRLSEVALNEQVDFLRRELSA
jgi:acetyl esterase/lipase